MIHAKSLQIMCTIYRMVADKPVEEATRLRHGPPIDCSSHDQNEKTGPPPATLSGITPVRLDPGLSLATSLERLMSTREEEREALWEQLGSLGSVNHALKEFVGSLPLAETLEHITELPPPDQPLYSAQSLAEIDEILLGETKDLDAETQRFIMMMCEQHDKAMIRPQVLCDVRGDPKVFKLHRGMERMRCPIPGSVARTTTTPASPSRPPASRNRTDADGAVSSVSMVLKQMKRFRDGLEVDTETSEVIRATLKVTTKAGRPRGRARDVPEGWDEPSDEEILANLLMENPCMKTWPVVDLKKEIRRARNRLSAALSRARKRMRGTEAADGHGP